MISISNHLTITPNYGRNMRQFVSPCFSFPGLSA